MVKPIDMKRRAFTWSCKQSHEKVTELADLVRALNNGVNDRLDDMSASLENLQNASRLLKINNNLLGDRVTRLEGALASLQENFGSYLTEVLGSVESQPPLIQEQPPAGQGVNLEEQEKQRDEIVSSLKEDIGFILDKLNFLFLPTFFLGLRPYYVFFIAQGAFNVMVATGSAYVKLNKLNKPAITFWQGVEGLVMFPFRRTFWQGVKGIVMYPFRRRSVQHSSSYVLSASSGIGPAIEDGVSLLDGDVSEAPSCYHVFMAFMWMFLALSYIFLIGHIFLSKHDDKKPVSLFHFIESTIKDS